METVRDPLSSCLVYLKNNIGTNAQEEALEDETRIVYRIACPVCGYKYILALFNEYGYEFCPVCGYGDSLASFIHEGKIRWG